MSLFINHYGGLALTMARYNAPNTRGLQFDVNFLPPGSIIERPSPNFPIFWDDLNTVQQKYVLLTHNFDPQLSVRDKDVIANIKKFLGNDIQVWKNNKLPDYVLLKSTSILSLQL